MLGERFINAVRQPTLEAQIANLADEIAYNNHDLDDGLRAGLITDRRTETSRRCSGGSTRSSMATYPALNGRRLDARSRSGA